MIGIKTLLSSPIFLVVASLVFAGSTLAALIPASTYITTTSLSTTDNFYLVSGLMLSLALASLFESLLVIRLVWGSEKEKPKERHLDDEPIVTTMRFMKATGTKKAFVFGIVLALNIIGYDQLGQGILVANSRRYHVLTQLRSPDAQTRADAAQNAIQLVGDPEVAVSLGLIMEEPGDAREWAAYAAGRRLDYSLKDTLADLLRTGNPRERSAAATAMARLKDGRLIRLAIDALPHMENLKGDALIAIGMMGKIRDVTSEQDIEEAGATLVEIIKDPTVDKEIRRLAIWVAGNIEARVSLPLLEGFLKPDTDTTTLCMALEALGNIGAADSSPKMIELLNKADKKAECDELVAADFTGHEVLVSGRLNLVQRILREIANIGDREAKIPLERLSENMNHSETVRRMAAEIAFQMRYSPPPRQ